MITYECLWETMKKKEISQYRLITYYGISAGQLSRLKKDRNVSTHTINLLCGILGCRVEDVMTFTADPSDKIPVRK